MPQPACVVAVSDSRGGGLATFLKNSDLVQSTVVREANFPGADLHSLLSHIREESNTAYRKYPTHRIVVILFGGICSFTTKHRGRGRQEIAYSSSTGKTAAIKAIYDDIWQLCKDNGYYLITTTIYPVSLEAHAEYAESRGRLTNSRYTTKQRAEQQKVLVDDLCTVNTYIAEKAISEGSSCVNIHKKFEKTGKKGGKNRRKRVVTRPVYDHLYDGVHADHLTKRQLFLKIAAACRHIIDPKTAEQSGTATEESESDREGWNFKRPRTDYE